MTDSQNALVKVSTSPAALEQLEHALRHPAEFTLAEVQTDPAEIQAEIVASLLAAESDEELNRTEAEGWQELEGVAVEVRGFAWRESAYAEQGGYPVFLVVRGQRMDDGSNVVLTTGSGNVMAQLVNLAKRGRIPGAVVRLVKAEQPTAQGFRPTWLEVVANTADKAEAEAVKA